MKTTDSRRVTELQSLISDFLTKRLEAKLGELQNGDPKYNELQEQFSSATWLSNAAQRVSSIQAVTHTLKAVHPSAKGSSLYVSPPDQKKLPVVGSHCLGVDLSLDVVGNAAALDVYKFLKLEHDGRSLLELVTENDADLAAAFSDDPAQAREWIKAFAGLITLPVGPMASHTLAKQVYWPVGDLDPLEDQDFHVLAPLHPSSLIHHVYQVVQDDRFSEEAKTARTNKKDGDYNERPVRDYPHLAIQKLGGSKPQNISQLNAERKGNNFLFASLPPSWRSADLKPLLGTDNMLYSFGRTPRVRALIKALLAFLKSNPSPNSETRKRRTAYVDDLIDEFLQFSAELRCLPPGWSQRQECRLSNDEKHWLDPDGVEDELVSTGRPFPTDTDARVSALFANWLNAQLRNTLPVGDPEYLEWSKQMFNAIKLEG